MCIRDRCRTWRCPKNRRLPAFRSALIRLRLRYHSSFFALFGCGATWTLEFAARAVTFTVMGKHKTKLYPVVTALFLTVGDSLPAVAQTTPEPSETPAISEPSTDAQIASVTQQERLNGMLQELRTASPSDALRLTREIEREWSKSGSTSLDLSLIHI